MFALIDCNNFYASCERAFRPDLNGKPIVVLSNNDGCVIARSNESKALKIPMGALAHEFEPFFKQHNVYVFSANFPLYGDMSHRVMSILEEFSPGVEIYSIDEAFLKLKGFELYNLLDYGQEMRRKVVQWTGIPISVGIAPTKALAKVANRIAKKFPKETGGVHIIDTEEKRIKALKWLKIEDVWGIGRQHAARLNTQNIRTAYDFTQFSEEWIRKFMTIVGIRLKRDLEGLPTLDLETIQNRKNIATTRSFEKNYSSFEEMEERICSFAVSCAEKLRKQGDCCQALLVFIKTNSHRLDLPQYRQSTVIDLPFATNSSMELAHYASLALQRIYKKDFMYKKAGVIVMEFSPEDQLQTTLFDNRDERHITLMKTVDAINKRFGQQKVRLAVQDQKRIWKMRQEHLSPRYTTNLDDVITVKV